mmetsp:Transcript_9244/g.17672  ORF Transcript_9244/g.17672 Transcript_9244/m.17672 type:complete len:180 (-) Transcript_9244:274-813(-)|eukprot:scaffold620_cov169-Amphora_coffeaeformis.AAC.18
MTSQDAASTAEAVAAQQSALADNIARKGKNAYYFAHAHKANGPQWDGKAEPRLLQKEALQEKYRQSLNSSFDYAKSNITTYAFLDEPKKVKLYVELEGVGEKCADDDIRLDYSERSLSLVVLNYRKDQPQCLSFAKLAGGITKAVAKKKENRIILTLTKAEETKWETINDKGDPDHEVV